MQNWISYPFIRIFISYGSGILLSQYVTYPFSEITLLGVTAGFLGLFYMVQRSDMAGFLVFLLICALGYLRNEMTKKEPDDFSGIEAYAGYILTDPKPGEKFQGMEFRVLAVRDSCEWTPVRANVQLFTSNLDSLGRNDQLLILGAPGEPKPVSNPGIFDYRGYLEKKGIYHIHYLKKWEKLGSRGGSVSTRIVETVRAWMDTEIKEHIYAEPSAIVRALVIGTRSELDQKTRKAFVETGAIHVLAVSGLHVGIIYGILLFAFGWLKQLPFGKHAFALTSIGLLFFYAAITGFSPSVLRAAVMFSFIILANSLRRQTNIYNTIFASAFFLLCADPGLLTNIGFQLSYSAVLSIVYFYPVINAWINPENLILSRIWDLTSVSLAAQAGTIPLTMYYFQQVPLYGIFSNLVVVPVAFLILSGTLLMLTFTSIIPGVAHILGILLSLLTSLMKFMITWINSWPYGLISNVLTDWPVSIGIYGILFCIGMMMSRHSRSWIHTLLITSLFVSTYISYLTWERRSERKIVIHHIKNRTTVSMVDGKKTIHVTNLDLKKDSLQASRVLAAFRKDEGIKKVEWVFIQDCAIQAIFFDLVIRVSTEHEKIDPDCYDLLVTEEYIVVPVSMLDQLIIYGDQTIHNKSIEGKVCLFPEGGVVIYPRNT